MLNRCLVFLAVCSLVPTGLHAQVRSQPSCERYQAAVRTDAANLDAAARLGQCSVRDYEMIAPGGDSSRLAFRSSWTAALLALRHAVRANPSYDRAYRPLFDILFAETRDGCSSLTGICSHVASNVRDGDTVITTPRLVRSDSAELNPYDQVVRETRAKGRANLTEARTHAERWVAVAPNDRRPHEYLGRALLRLGEPAAAASELERAAMLGNDASRRNLFWDRLEALVKADRGNDARRVLDDAVSDPARDTSQLGAYSVAGINSLLGRNRPVPVGSAVVQRNRARFDSMMRSRPPILPPQPAFSRRLEIGDTAGARRELARLDSDLAPRRGMLPRILPTHLTSAEWHLALGDTTAAEARLNEIEQAIFEGHFRFNVTVLYDSRWLGPAWMLSGNVASSRRRFADAARMYRRLVGLWAGADGDLQPLVTEARAKLASLPAR